MARGGATRAVDAALLHAARRGDLEAMLGALAAGADPCAVDEYGASALHSAAGRGDAAMVTAMVTVLLSAGAAPDCFSGNDWWPTPLHRAACCRGDTRARR